MNMIDIGPPDFGARFQELRERRGLSQPALAGLTGISQRKISDIERGVREARFSPHEWVFLSEALDVSLYELMGIEAATTKVELIARVADDLLDSDIEALTIMARQIASARAAALPHRERIPGWDQLPANVRSEYERAEALVRRVARLRSAEDQSPPRSGGANSGAGKRQARRRGAGGAAGS